MSWQDDSRYSGQRKGNKDRETFNPDKMVFIVNVWAEDLTVEECKILDPSYQEEPGDVEFLDVEIPAVYEVCGTCNGKGKHVNPAIDSNGLSREDFDEDPDFEEEYFSGFYDVECYECGGLRVSPRMVDEVEDKVILTPAQRIAKKAWEKRLDADAEYEAVCRAERRMGC